MSELLSVNVQELSDLKVGDKVFFKAEKRPYTVQATGADLLIVNKNMGFRKRYSILDPKNDFCGPHDRVFNSYDLTSKEGCEKLMMDIVSGAYFGIEISRRNGAKISEVIDLEKTLQAIKSVS